VCPRTSPVTSRRVPGLSITQNLLPKVNLQWEATQLS